MHTLKASPADRKQAEHLLSELIKQLNEFSKSTPSQNDLEKYFTQNLVVVNNDKPIIHSLNDLLAKFREFKNEFSHASYTKLQDSFVCDGNKWALRYNIDLTTKAGKKTQFQASANLTIEDGKIAKIEQLLNEKGNNTYTR